MSVIKEEENLKKKPKHLLLICLILLFTKEIKNKPVKRYF